MSTTTAVTVPARDRPHRVRPPVDQRRTSAFATLARRRLSLSARTPRELVVPLLTPVLFALVIAPALASIGPKVHGLDYMSFAAVGTVALLVPLNCMFSGIGVIIDRESGARRDLLAGADRAAAHRRREPGRRARRSPRCRSSVLIGAAVLRGADLPRIAHAASPGSSRAATLLGVGMYGVAETLANRVPTRGGVHRRAARDRRSCRSSSPVRCSRSRRCPRSSPASPRVLPLTHALALMRYGLLDNASGLHDIWGMGNATAMAALSLAVVAAFADPAHTRVGPGVHPGRGAVTGRSRTRDVLRTGLRARSVRTRCRRGERRAQLADGVAQRVDLALERRQPIVGRRSTPHPGRGLQLLVALPEEAAAVSRSSAM